MTPSKRRIIAVLATGAAIMLPIGSPARAGVRGDRQNGRIAFQRVDFERQSIAIFTVNPNGTGLRQLTSPPRGVETGRMEWSPDGRWIAYMRVHLSGSWRPHILVMRPNGTHRTDLTKGSCRLGVCNGEEDPAWSPDGKRLAFIRLTGYAPSIFVMRTDGTHRHRVMTPPSDRYVDSAPGWSPDGTHLVFARFDNIRQRTALFAVRLGRTGARRITRWGLDDLNRPDWSPDGRWILFQQPANSGGPTQLCMIHPNGTGFRKVTHTPHYGWIWGAFSPEGTMITAVRVPGEASENDVYVVDLDGTGIQAVTGSLSAEGAEGLPDWGSR